MTYPLKLSKVTAGLVSQLFETVDIGSYVFNSPSRYDVDGIDKFNFIDNTTSAQITNMFHSKDFIISSSILESDPSQTPKRIDEVGPDTVSGYIHLAQIGESILGLTELTPETIRFLAIPETYDVLPIYLRNIGIYSLKDFERSEPFIAAYLPSSEIMSLSTSYEENAMAPYLLLSGVSHNYMSEIDCEDNTLYFDFDSGKILANTGNMKNMYDPRWDCNTSYTRNYFSPSKTRLSDIGIKNTREYKCIGNNQNTLWASYNFYHSYNYPGTKLVDSTSPADLNGFYSNVIPVCTYEDTTLDEYALSALEYENIEQIIGFNRLAFNKLHKSNLFSIAIRNSNLNTALSGDLAVSGNNIRQSINNIVRSMITKITPAHTQLFDVYWTGK